MPDKSKKRKNNKNKRKNKGQNQNGNTSKSVVVNIDQIGSTSDSGNKNENDEYIQSNKMQILTSSCMESLETEQIIQDQELSTNIDLKTNIELDNDVTNATTSSDTNDESITNLNYVVEPPKPHPKGNPKLRSDIKSKSVDNDDGPSIVELSEDDNCGDDLNRAALNSSMITEVESDIEWEKADDIKEIKHLSEESVVPGALSIVTIPLSEHFAICEQTKSLSPEEESSLRNYLYSLNLSTNPTDSPTEINTEIENIINNEVKLRLRKKALVEESFPRPSRSLAVIAEEASGESSTASCRQSYLSDIKSETDELDDDVFEPCNTETKKLKSLSKNFSPNLIPQKCFLVDAKLKGPDISEAKGSWTTKTVEKMTGAEVVYLTDSSSSTSSMHDINDNDDQNEEIETCVRIITPTIEVTDTEKLLKKNYAIESNIKQNKDSKTVTSDISDEFSVSQSLDNTDNTKILNDEANKMTSKNIESHEIIVDSTSNFNTSLIVKDVDNDFKHQNTEYIEGKSTSETHEFKEIPCKSKKIVDDYDLEIKVLKCELNVAINNLIKEVSSDSETSNDIVNYSLISQDSSSSISSSQCTAKYIPRSSSLNDLSNFELDEFSNAENSNMQIQNNTSHVIDVIQKVENKSNEINGGLKYLETIQPKKLRDMCLKKISEFPFGEKILEELANVSYELEAFSDKIPSLFNISSIKGSRAHGKEVKLHQMNESQKSIPTPPVRKRHSSLNVLTENSQRYQPKDSELKENYQCLSPSHKMLIEKTNTDTSKTSHEKLVEDQKVCSNFNKKTEEIAELEVPFKSQTGSRLLALLRNPTLSKSSKDLNENKNDFRNKFIEKDHLGRISTKNSLCSIRPTATKMSSCFSEYDNKSHSTLNHLKPQNKFLHYSTGALNKDIEDDISSIQKMYRYDNIYKTSRLEQYPRRPSLPKDLCDQQLEYICRKEKEVEAEINRLENEQKKCPPRRGPRAPMLSDNSANNSYNYKTNNREKYGNLNTNSFHKNKYETKSNISSLFGNSQEEILREQMYSEYVCQMAEREQRKHKKIIKISRTPLTHDVESRYSKSMTDLQYLKSKVNNRIEKEFIDKAKERWNKLGIKDPETEDELRENDNNLYKESKVINHNIKVIDSGEEKDVKNLPCHLQDFVRFTAKEKTDKSDSPAIWKPGVPPPPSGASGAATAPSPPPPPPPPVWTPNSTTSSPLTPKKLFRPVHFEESPPARKKFENSEQNGCMSNSETESRLRTSQSAPATGLHSLASRLPRVQNPTVTLLQKAREGQVPRTSGYPSQDKDARLPRDRPSPPVGDPVHALRRGYVSEGEGSRSDKERVQTMTDTDRQKIEGVGPTTREGMPVTLRSEVKDPSKWYKKMYDTIHKNKYDNDYVTIRYKSRRDEEPQRVSSSRSQYAYFDPRSGYLSEPEGGLRRLTTSTWSDAYDSDAATGPRRRTASVQEDRRDVSSPYLANNKYSTLASTRASHEVYKTQPGKIENYTPGKSSVVEKEAKQWWDEVMDIFDGWLDENSPLPPYSTLLLRAIHKNQNISSTTSLPQASPKEKKDLTSAILSKSNMARALKESGYESDSTLIFKRREETEAPLSPADRRAAYRDLQAGGEPPLRGFRSPAPPRTESDSAPDPPQRKQHGCFSDSESPNRRYVESDVNIHYRIPVRHDPLPLVPERELARQQAEHMKRLYREQKRNKYLQENDINPIDIEAFDASIKELQDMQNRRHQDNFTPSQKAVVPLNRYDEAEKIVARALYTFNGQTSRELSFKKGELIHVRRQIDNNWYEGEIHGKVGLFPYNYVELLKGDVTQTPKKQTMIEGRARAKFDFTAQTNLELPLKKGEVVVLTRRIDHNWWEGRLGNKMGIFPDSYVTVIQEPSQNKPEARPILCTDKPVAAPAAHGLLNGSDKRSMGSHNYIPQPNSPALANAPPATQPLIGYPSKAAHPAQTPSERGYGPPTGAGVDLNNTEPLYVDTNAEAVPYRAMYKYRPQNPDELELNEGDTVYVLEKCDDGWYVGSSQRTGRFGTFPGNYVERI
ncbi:uncharacterized protein LOC126964952 isoform X3 [Leptidea sinapis]|uniref:uncharacterized protein LOC126964952 isoform X3 n=1 Tax=Leptidea sinapis TaxID=189913 RepID=UPI0021C254FA|nr:uncharacterized protein LOC126964952 isoform X3 [Leptidea sinapis]